MSTTTTPSINTTYAVAGMSCAHCVNAITETVSEVPGVAVVAVDLAAGTLTVGGSDVSADAVRAAVAEAGYEVIA